MNKTNKHKIDKTLLVCIILLAITSIITIYSAQTILKEEYHNLAIKQAVWYLIGSVIVIIIMFIKNSNILKYTWILYLIGNISLLGLLFFGTPINDAKCWYTIKGIGTIQPSEFMKIILILTLAQMIDKFHEEHSNPTPKEEFVFLFKVGFIILIPCILTFLQPDTGVVLIYLLITVVMLFIGGIRYRWFILLFGILAFCIGSVLTIYFLNNDLFIKNLQAN